jgi:type IV pilus assembly protein PilC
VQISRFTRTLATLTSSGIPILQALAVVEKTISNAVLQRAIRNIRTALVAGSSLVEPFKATGLFSPMVIQMISIGERSGKMDEMLDEVSNFYDPEIEYTIKNLTSLLEPFMLLAMGLMVSFIALSVLLPIFNLMKVFRT